MEIPVPLAEKTYTLGCRGYLCDYDIRVSPFPRPILYAFPTAYRTKRKVGEENPALFLSHPEYLVLRLLSHLEERQCLLAQPSDGVGLPHPLSFIMLEDDHFDEPGRFQGTEGERVLADGGAGGRGRLFRALDVINLASIPYRFIQSRGFVRDRLSTHIYKSWDTYNILEAKNMLVKFELYKDGKHWCARGIGVDIFTQGKTLDNLMSNLKEAVELHFEDDLKRGEEVKILSISEMEVGTIA